MTISVSPSAKRNTSKVNLPQSAHQEVREVIARDFNYGLKNLEEGLSTPVRFSGTNRLIKLEAQKQAAWGRIPNLEDVCKDLFNVFFAENSTYTALEFVQAMKKDIVLDKLAVSRFIRNPESSHILVENEFIKIVLIHWAPGKYSRKHPHPGSGGVIKVLKGSLEEKRYHRDEPRKLLSHSTYHKDAIAYIDDHMGYHAVGNPFETSAISLHAYVKK